MNRLLGFELTKPLSASTIDVSILLLVVESPKKLKKVLLSPKNVFENRVEESEVARRKVCY